MIEAIEESMAAKRRLSIEVGDIEERIERCRNDVAWKEMTLTNRLRVLIIERLEELEAEKERKND